MGNCCKTSVRKGDLSIKRPKATKQKELTVRDELAEISFVDIVHKDGNTSQYIYNPPAPITASASEILNIFAETIDQKRTSLQVSANEKVLALKQKVCESLCLSEVLLIFEGKPLDLNEIVGSSIPQGSCLDVIAV